MALTWNSVLKMWVASEASRQIAEDRRSGSIELLLSTPLAVSDIRAGQALSLLRLFAWPAIVVAGVECVLVLLGIREIGNDEEGILIWSVTWACGIVMLFADLVGLFLVGLWWGASAKSPAKAARGAALRILTVPWVVFLVLVALWVVAHEFRWIRTGRSPGWFFWVGSWTGLGLLANIIFGLLSWRAFGLRFRELAAQRGPEGGWGRRLGRAFGRLKGSTRAS